MSTVALRWHATIYAGGTPSKERLEYWQDGDIPWLNSGSVNDWSICTPSAHITADAFAASSARWVPAKSVVVALAGQGKTKGTAARLEIPSTCNQSMAAIVPSDRLDYRYLHYSLVARYSRIRNMAGGDVRDGLNLQHIGDIRIRLAPLEEQRRIADFLDDQVSKIDSICEMRRSQTRSWNESTTSDVIQTLLAGGKPASNLASPFDNLPEQWPVRKLGSVWNVIDCKHRTPEYQESGYPVVSPGDIRPGRLDLSGCQRFVSEEDFIDLADDLRRCIPGDLVFSRNASLGAAALVGDGQIFTMGQDVCRITSEVPSQAFLGHILNFAIAPQIEALRIGSTFSRINIAAIKSILVPVPGFGEQSSISSKVDEILEGAHLRRTLVAQSLDSLQEYKDSLITAAVMGESDVTTARRGVPA